MSGREPFETAWAAAGLVPGGGVRISELLALSDEGRTPLVADMAQPPGVALRARSIIDLDAVHIGRQVLLVFEGGDPAKPIVIGVLRGVDVCDVPSQPGRVDVDLDGARLTVSAQRQLVLRCGKASITLTRSGKVLIEGSYVLSRSTGTNLVKGGSVQLN